MVIAAAPCSDKQWQPSQCALYDQTVSDGTKPSVSAFLEKAAPVWSASRPQTNHTPSRRPCKTVDLVSADLGRRNSAASPGVCR